jgi:RNA polymerase sigma-70 factor (ECF subfamily)
VDRENSAALLRRARNGSTDAIGVLFEECGERLLAFIRLRLGAELRREIESRDVLQNTFLKALDGIERFEGSGVSTLQGWLAIIASNEIRDQADFYRRLRRDARLRTSLSSSRDIPAEPVRSEVSRIELKEQTSRLERAMEALSPQHREVILLRDYEELGFREIGERSSRSPDAARMLYARAMTKLTVQMQAARPQPG